MSHPTRYNGCARGCVTSRGKWLIVYIFRAAVFVYVCVPFSVHNLGREGRGMGGLVGSRRGKEMLDVYLFMWFTDCPPALCCMGLFVSSNQTQDSDLLPNPTLDLAVSPLASNKPWEKPTLEIGMSYREVLSTHSFSRCLFEWLNVDY